MARPMSGKPRPLSAKNFRPKSAGGNIGDVETYQQLLLAQYLKTMKNSQPFSTVKSSLIGMPSPYSQQLAHSHIVPAPGLSRNRPFSAKPKLQDSTTEFIDATGQPMLSPRDKRKKRPFSAPARRPLSASYGYGSRPVSAKSGIFGGRRVKPLYKRQPLTIVATAFKNGSRDIFARVAAPSLKMLLELCTDKLNLGNAARRVFLEDGTEIHSPSEIYRDADIFISMGEPFKDPDSGAKKHTVQQSKLNWTMNGLIWPHDNKKKGTKPRLSRRFRDMIEQSRRRVLVFRNGAGTEGVEIVADPDRFEDFLVACTAKLDLGSYARVLYDWEGNAISNLDEAPVLDTCLQTWGTPVLGPLWVSKGEGFSPKGANEFLTGLVTYTKSKLKEAKDYQQQLKYAQDDDEDMKQHIKIAPILSMGETEIEETLEIVANDIEEFSNALNRLKELLASIRDKYTDEQTTPGYTLQHISKLEADHRMVGTKGLRLRVFENGTYDNETIVYFNLQQATRGIGNETKKLLARLLDQLSSSHHLANPKQNTALNLVAQKIYDNQGKELKNVFELEYDHEIWLSFGEPWKNPFTFVLTATFDKARAFDVEGQGRKACREQLMSEDVVGKDRPNLWECVEGIPDEFNAVQINSGMDAMDREHAMAVIQTGEILPEAHFLLCKDNPELMLFPDITMDTKKKKTSTDVWPSEAQIWILSKNGNICCKSMPNVVLAVVDQHVKTILGHPTLGPTETHVEGFLVCLQCKNGSAAQQWGYSAEGYIYNQSQPELVLTYLGSRFGDEDSMVANEEENFPKGMKCYVAVCEKLEGKESKAQRWAMKQERYDNLGQWKHTQAENPEWHKRALSWPVKQDGEFNDDYDWPMEGYLVPYAPTLKKTSSVKINQASKGPLRLMVLKNGVRELNKAVAVVGPDLNNMRKDVHPKKGKKKGHRRAKSVNSNEDSTRSEEELTVLKLEFILFLERCTALLDLPFAARRLFDESGKEHFTLINLHRDQLVYVSCGDAWSDPTVSKAEQQRRYLLTNVGSDVGKIRQYSAMRNPETSNQANNLSSGRPTSAKQGRKGSKKKGKQSQPAPAAENTLPPVIDAGLGQLEDGEGSYGQGGYQPQESESTGPEPGQDGIYGQNGYPPPESYFNQQYGGDTQDQDGYDAPKIVVRPPSAKKPAMDYDHEYHNGNSHAYSNGVDQSHEYGNGNDPSYGYDGVGDEYQQFRNPQMSYEESPMPSVRGSLASMDNVNGMSEPGMKPVVVEMPDSHSSGEQDENTPPTPSSQRSKGHRVSFRE